VTARNMPRPEPPAKPAKRAPGAAPRVTSPRLVEARSFDAAYFRRYYESRRSRVYGKEQIDHLAQGVTGLVRWFGGEIDRVLDVGAGTGLWKEWFAEHLPVARYRSVDVSAYACAKYGHERRDISRWRARERFDLVVCQGVLPYLDDDACARAIANMAAMCRGFLYVEAITSSDLRDVCDRTKTDVSVRARPAAFYRKLLRQHFERLGCGLHHVKGGDKLFYDLERG
jgi:SAM-dependent methyltransferase